MIPRGLITRAAPLSSRCLSKASLRRFTKAVGTNEKPPGSTGGRWFSPLVRSQSVASALDPLRARPRRGSSV